MATVAELKSRADALGVTYPSKIRKADLEELIAAATRPARMDNHRRTEVYMAQRNGSGRLTKRQLRRIRKTGNRAMGRAA